MCSAKCKQNLRIYAVFCHHFHLFPISRLSEKACEIADCYNRYRAKYVKTRMLFYKTDRDRDHNGYKKYDRKCYLI